MKHAIDENLLGCELTIVLKQNVISIGKIGGFLQSVQILNGSRFWVLYSKTGEMYAIPENNISFIVKPLEQDELEEFFGETNAIIDQNDSDTSA